MFWVWGDTKQSICKYTEKSGKSCTFVIQRGFSVTSAAAAPSGGRSTTRARLPPDPWRSVTLPFCVPSCENHPTVFPRTPNWHCRLNPHTRKFAIRNGSFKWSAPRCPTVAIAYRFVCNWSLVTHVRLFSKTCHKFGRVGAFKTIHSIRLSHLAANFKTWNKIFF